MKWITRKDIKVDRVACPWLIKRFVDPQAEFLFVDEKDLVEQSKQHDAIPFDAPKIDAIKLNHRGFRCSFEAILEDYAVSDPALQKLALIVRAADVIIEEEIRAAGLYESIWQSFGVLLPVRSVGVMGDARTYEETLAVRAVHSRDGMTADWVQLPYDVLGRISSRVINEVRGINRVVYDITSKPPGTIEWE